MFAVNISVRAYGAVPNIFFLGTEGFQFRPEIQKRPHDQDQHCRKKQVQKNRRGDINFYHPLIPWCLS
jgi:hypothetical protein